MKTGDVPDSLFLAWRHGYNRTLFKGDLVAGLTVGIVLIPQGMAYAILAGVPPVYGLYASLIPLLVYAVLGTSRQLAAGIVAIDSLIIAAGVGALAPSSTVEFLGYAFLLALMVGVIQLTLGLLRFGFVVNLLSGPVITGFTAAASLIIGISQLQHLTGIPLGRNLNIFAVLGEASARISELHMPSFAIGLAGILVLILVSRWIPRIPGPLVVVLFSALAVYWGGLDDQGVAIVGAIPAGLPHLTAPAFSFAAVRELLPTALTLSFIQFMGVISLGKLFSGKYGFRVQANRELKTLGAMNLAGSFFQSIPVSASYSRSAVNDRSGAQTPLANGITALLILTTLLFLTPVFYYLPIPIFASIIMVAAFGLINVSEVRFLLKTKAVDGVIALLTFFSTLIIGIEQGVLAGIGFSVIAIMLRIGRPHFAILGHLPHSRSFRDVKNHAEAHQFEGVVILRIDASFSFANADFLQDLIQEHIQSEAVRAIILDASSVNDLDTTALATLREINRIAHRNDVLFYLASVRDKTLTMLRTCGVLAEIGESHFSLSTHRALLDVLSQWGREQEYLDRLVPKASPGPADGDAQVQVEGPGS